MDTAQFKAEHVGVKRKAVPNKESAEPIKRGLIGNFAYHLGMFLTKSFVTVEVRGSENLPTQAPYIIAANHETYVDGMWIMSCLTKNQRKQFCCIGAEDLLKNHGFFGKVIMRVGRGIPIKRGGNPLRALITAKSSLEKDNILLVHPEGTRTRTGKLGKIQQGAAFLSKKAEVPLVPLFLDGAYNIFPSKNDLPHLRDIRNGKRLRLIITIGEAMMPADFSDAKDMNEALDRWMHQRYDNKEIPNYCTVDDIADNDSADSGAVE